MSCLYKGEIVESEQSKNSNGGTEMMRQRVLDNVDFLHLQKVAIHFSRPRELYDDVPNILYCHDLAEDPENEILKDGGWKKFDHFVFVSAWQRDMYVIRYGIPYSECSVIYNAIEKQYEPKEKNTETVRFIYHTTPHRGLELLVPIFEALCQQFPNIHLDVYSGFDIYGWPERDAQYQGLYTRIDAHPNMTYHGVQDNETILKALEDAHVFLYPNIWRETSCIALIEAIKSQVICIHPNLGALPETACNATIMYDFNEDPQIHANYAFAITAQLLVAMQNDPNYLNKWTFSDRFALARNNIDSFTTIWNQTLRNVLDGTDD